MRPNKLLSYIYIQTQQNKFYNIFGRKVDRVVILYKLKDWEGMAKKVNDVLDGFD